MTNAQITRRAAELLQDDANQWKHIHYNLVALDTLEKGIIAKALENECDTVTYSDLMLNLMVDVSTFVVGSSGRGPDHPFPAPEWDKLHSAMVEEFLRVISISSASEQGFMTSALVVYAGKRSGKVHWPGKEFFLLARELNLFSSRGNEQIFLDDQRRQACAFYHQNPTTKLTQIALKKIEIP